MKIFICHFPLLTRNIFMKGSVLVVHLTSFLFLFKNLIQNLEEETVRRLAIRVLSRGIGSLEFIQIQLVPEDESGEGPMVYVHGSPVRRLSVRKRQDLPHQAPRTFSQTFPPNRQHQTDSLCQTDHQHQTDQGSQSHLSLTGASVAIADKCQEP